MKRLLTLIIFTGISAQAAPNQWTFYSCNQVCGLTENSPNQVSFSSVDYYETLKALQVLCESRKMQLQKKPNCNESTYDKTENENFQRCRAGIEAKNICRVEVVGYKDGQTSSSIFFSNFLDSFDQAEDQAMEKCRTTLNNYGARCVIRNYSTYY